MCTAPYPRLPMTPETVNNDPEVQLGPRVNTTGCGACKDTEIQARDAYHSAYLDCELQPTEPERRNCRRLAWIFYLDTVYDCFENAGCFDA